MDECFTAENAESAEKKSPRRYTDLHGEDFSENHEDTKKERTTKSTKVTKRKEKKFNRRLTQKNAEKNIHHRTPRPENMESTTIA